MIGLQSINHDLNSLRDPDLSAEEIQQWRQIADRNVRIVDAANTWGIPPHPWVPIPRYLKKGLFSFLYMSRGGVPWDFTIGHEARQPAEGGARGGSGGQAGRAGKGSWVAQGQALA